MLNALTDANSAALIIERENRLFAVYARIAVESEQPRLPVIDRALIRISVDRWLKHYIYNA